MLLAQRVGYTPRRSRFAECSEIELYVGFIPGFADVYSQAESLDELNQNLREVIEMLLKDGEPIMLAEFVAPIIIGGMLASYMRLSFTNRTYLHQTHHSHLIHLHHRHTLK